MNKKMNFFKLNMQFFADGARGNRSILKDGINTGGDYGANGLLSPADAEKFIIMLKEDSSFLGKLDSETVGRIDGSISKLGVGRRLLRNYTESNDSITGNEVVPIIGNVPYHCKRMTLGSAISEAWIQENFEKENFETLFMQEIAGQIKVDILDLSFNGDEGVKTGDSDYEFLRLNDGFIKQIREHGNIVDGATIDNGKFSKAMFYALRRAIPKKFRTNKFKWICSDDTYTDLCEYLSNRPTSLGDIAITKDDGNITILQTGFETVPYFPNDLIIYADPKNLKVVYFGQIRHRKADSGKDAIYKDERYYADHMCVDFVIKEVEATAMLINRGELE